MLLLALPMAAQHVLIDNFNQLKVVYDTPKPSIAVADYVRVDMEGYTYGGEMGAPALPVSTTLLTVPFCDKIEVMVENAVYDTMPLPEGTLMPLMPSNCKSDRGPKSVTLDEQVYSTDAFYGRPLATVTQLGIGRDRNYAVLHFSPVSVNPVSKKMIVCRSADVTLRYHGSDAAATVSHYERYHTPAFSMGATLNSLGIGSYGPKGGPKTAALRMVIVAPQSLECTALDDLVAWKRAQGMLVDMMYIPSGTTAASVAATLKQLYEAASDDAPAPAYLLLVGDDNDMPAFPSDLSSSNDMHSYWYQLDDHVTDFYYALWTDDDLPDCYQGRMSARDTATLRAIIEKTIYYERYDFVDDSYLTRATLIAGVDYGSPNDNAYQYADPTMDYIAYFYVNDASGFDIVSYYKNNTGYSPDGVNVTGSNRGNGVASVLRNLYNTGMGWVNYSAHGDWNEWSNPEFTVNHVSHMSNNDMPAVMIGNCCLSNKFDETTCLGEALLRKDSRAGAVAYIGATNSTFWGEDFYWAVGYRSNVTNTITPTYNPFAKGMYDRLFHTHDEDLSDYAVTAGSMLVAGNMSVYGRTGTSSWATSMAEYYWEIYELMGDPSLMPWLGTADVLTVSMALTDGWVDVTAVPGAYVALLHGDGLEVVAAAFAGSDGVARIPAPAVDVNECVLSVTAQGYRPFLSTSNSVPVTVDEAVVAEVIVSPNPASGSCVVSAPGLKHVAVLNMVGQTLQSRAATSDVHMLQLGGLPVGMYMLRIESAAGISVRKLIVK